jgi:hypothetical protein
VIVLPFVISTLQAISRCLLPRSPPSGRCALESLDVLDREAACEQFAADLIDFNDALL